MILMSIFNSVEFYVLATVLAAAVVGLCVRPSGRVAAETLFAEGALFADDACAEPSIEIDVRDDGAVTITRRGLDGVTLQSRVSLAITRIGFDVSIQERVAGVPDGEPAGKAVFVLDFLGAERYHFSYRCEESGLFAACTVAVRSGIHVSRELKR